MITRSRMLAIAAILLLVPVTARAQNGDDQRVAEPQRPTVTRSFVSRLWLVGGMGYAVARAGCDICDPAGQFHESRSVTVTGGLHVTPRVDAGIEAHWVGLKVGGDDPMRTTFILGTAQLRPWDRHGFFVRTGLGVGIVGRGLYRPFGPSLAPPYTTNALGFVYGAGWLVKVKDRWAIQAHATHYVAALGELTKADGTTMLNVVGNYWTVGMAIVVR